MTIYLTCQICLDQHKNFRALAQHISRHKITSKTYYDQYLKKETDGKCSSCGTETNWTNMNVGYAKMCHSCRMKETAHKQWSSEKGLCRKKELSHRMKDNTFSKGRPKNSKNKNEYPIHSVLDRLKKNPMPSWLGKNHSEETKKKMSLSAYKRMERIGLPRKSYKGKFSPKNPKKYKGDPTNIIWRSLWEKKVMQQLDDNTNVLEWSSEETVVLYFDPVQNKIRRYFPDFIVKVRKSDGSSQTLMLEVKPKAQTIEPKIQKRKTKQYITEVTTWATNSAKWEAAREYCADRGWEFKLITETELGIKY